MSKYLKRVSAPTRDLPLNMARRLAEDIKLKKIKPNDTINLSQYVDDSPEFKEVSLLLKRATTKLGPDGTLKDATLMIDGKDTTIRVDEIPSYLEGDSFAGNPPRIREFYEKLGLTKKYLDSPTFKASVDEINTNFRRTKAYADGVRERLVKDRAGVYQKQYGDGPEGVRKYAEDNPEQFDKLCETLEKSPFFKAKMKLNETFQKSYDGVKGETKSNLLYKSAKYLAFIAIAAPVIWRLVEDYRMLESGCRYYDSDGYGDKIELLTCNDDWVEQSRDSKSVRLRKTCETQNFPSQTIIACGSDTFNPCLGTANNRASSETASFPFVPDVCDQYLHRKTLGAKDTSTNVTRIDSCPKNEGCSPYCNAEYFGSSLPPGVSLKCRDLTWWEGAIDAVKSIGEDAVCLTFPLVCKAASAGSDTAKWIKYTLIVVFFLVVVLGGFFVYRKFFTSEK